MSHVNILNYHPQLAPDIFKILSNALTSAEQKIVVLECKLQNQISGRRPNAAATALDIANTELARVHFLYEREKEKGCDLRAALEETKIHLRRKEMAVEAFCEGVEEKMQIFRETTEAIVSLEAAKVYALQTQLNGRDSELEMLRDVNGCLREDNARLRKRLTGDNDLTGRTRLHAGEFKSDGSNGVASLDFETDEMDIERFSAAPPVDQHPVRTTAPSTDAIWPPSLNDNHHTEQRSQISDEYAQEWSSQLFDAEKPSMESSDAPASTSRKKNTTRETRGAPCS